MSRVVLKNITKVFDNQLTAISDFSLEVNEGECMVVVGPSGCGKTTLLRMIAGLEQPTSGEIYLDDTLVNNIAPQDRDVAMVFQNYALYPHMNVYQNLAFALRMRKVPQDQIKAKVNQTAKLLDLEPLLSRKPHTLSGGQRQRVALGRVLVRRSKVFLFDEPLSNLDPQLRTKTRIELKELRRKLSATTIYVTHDQTEAMTLGDRICVVNNGVIQQIGSPIEIHKKPANPFVAGFFGSPPMNFFTGRMEIKENAACIIIDNDIITLPASLRSGLSRYNHQEMVLGIRPEHLTIHNNPVTNPDTISATIDNIEITGTHKYIYLTTSSGQRCVVTTQPHSQQKIYDVVKIHLDKHKIHVFTHNPYGKNVMG